MLKKLTNYGAIVHLVPMSGIQFLDFGFNERDCKVPGRFVAFDGTESGFEACELTSGESEYDLQGLISRRELDSDQVGAAFDPIDMTLAAFNAAWLPFPVLRARGVAEDGAQVYDVGPTTWARARAVRLAQPDAEGNTHRVQIAFDTALDSRIADRPYTVPTPEDARIGQDFRPVEIDKSIEWFDAQVWVREWFEQLGEAAEDTVASAFPRDDDTDSTIRPDWWARALYRHWVSIIVRLCNPPQVRLVDVVSQELAHTPIDVDLVLDIGNSRTCGLLVERHREAVKIGESYPLELRDLSAPEFSYQEPFESRVEFSRTGFGAEHRQAIQKSFRSRAFEWPSLLRVGFEAGRLHGRSTRTLGTGMSSPKRYLWDFEPSAQVWRFNGNEDEPVSGTLLNHLTDDGYVRTQLDNPGRSPRLRRAARERGIGPAFSANFSRSNIYPLMLAEILLHAVTQINSVDVRMNRQHTAIPRTLRRVTVTIPPATPLPERQIMAEHVRAAVSLVWSSFQWSKRPEWAERSFNPEPEVWTEWDEATCTQLVFLYFEIVEKYRESVSEFCHAMQLAPYQDGKARLRIASVDMGGGTTDLMIITYNSDGEDALIPKQEFREGFKIAGDDILEQVVARHVLPNIASAIARADENGVADGGKSEDLVRDWVAGDRGGQSESDRLIRRHFVTQICVPAALAILAAYERYDWATDEANVEIPLVDHIEFRQGDTAEVAHRLEKEVADQLGVRMRFAKVVCTVDFRDLRKTVEAVIKGPLRDMGEVIRHFDCDFLLVSGRPSRLPVVEEILLNTQAVPAHRLVPMSRYRAGKEYPFRSVDGRLRDPKTTVAVGAMLARLAKFSIANFAVRTDELSMRSTANYIGKLNLGDRIRSGNELFGARIVSGSEDEEDHDFYGDAKAVDEVAEISLETRTPIGFRQLPLERWTATPLYMLEWGQGVDPDALKRPLKVTIRRSAPPPDEEDQTVREEFVIERITEKNGTAHDLKGLSAKREERAPVVRKLRTLGQRYETGYWLDSGVIDDF